MKIMSMIRFLCLSPFILIYGAWLVFKFALGLSVLIVAAWLIHVLFGKAGDFVLVLPIIYGLTCFLPNLPIDGMTHLFKFKRKFQSHQRRIVNSNVVELKHFQRNVKP